MAKIYMVRHGQAASAWGGAPDPGLSPLGKQQAAAAAQRLAPSGPIRILTSPMARARETAQALCAIWQAEAAIEPRVSEIPTPADAAMRGTGWLYDVMQDCWSNLDPGLQAWRRGILDAVLELREDTVIFSHFISINVLAGEATGNDMVVVFSPENASITTFSTDHGRLSLLEKGEEKKDTIVRPGQAQKPG